MEKYLDMPGLSYYDSKLAENFSVKTDKSELPIKINELENDIGFLTSDNIPETSTASNTTPKMDGISQVGTEKSFARGDHVNYELTK